MKRILGAAKVFLLFLVVGSAWNLAVRFLPAGIPRNLILVGLGLVFASMFVWLLVSQLRRMLRTPDRLVFQITIIMLELVLLIFGFGLMYQAIGIMNNTRPDSPTTHDLGVCVYYSIVTLTTLGYGDFYPLGVGRALAGIEALTGYLVLAILASSSVSLLSPHQEPKLPGDRDVQD
jgi:prepilin signal peptidase PulO-like enzyme (type II secretory pathway)